MAPPHATPSRLAAHTASASSTTMRRPSGWHGADRLSEALLMEELRQKMEAAMQPYDAYANSEAQKLEWRREWVKRVTIVKPKHFLWNLMGLLAGIITLAAVSFQIAEIYRRRSACDLSEVYLAGLFVTQAMWAFYGIGNGLWVNTLTSGIGLAVIAWIIGLKAFFDSPSKCSAREEAVAAMRLQVGTPVF
jgi:uncharacterized protein with PQ loop repeat